MTNKVHLREDFFINRSIYIALPVNQVREDGTHMTLLSIIEKLNKKSINPDMDGLLEHANLFESHLEYIITSLLEKGYINKESNSKLYDTYDYIATEKGKDLLVQYRIPVKNLITSIMQLPE